MIIQNATLTSQAGAPDRQVSIDPPKVAAETPKSIAPQQPTHQQLKNAVAVTNKVMMESNQNLQFSLDPTTHDPIIKMMDAETGEVIRQIPSKEMLAIARSIDQFQQGLLLNQKA